MVQTGKTDDGGREGGCCFWGVVCWGRTLAKRCFFLEEGQFVVCSGFRDLSPPAQQRGGVYVATPPVRLMPDRWVLLPPAHTTGRNHACGAPWGVLAPACVLIHLASAARARCTASPGVWGCVVGGFCALFERCSAACTTSTLMEKRRLAGSLGSPVGRALVPYEMVSHPRVEQRHVGKNGGRPVDHHGSL